MESLETNERNPSSREQQEDHDFLHAPWNFSWIVPGEICASASPSTKSNVDFLWREGVRVLVTLSEDRRPHNSAESTMECCLIPVEEFEDPTMEQISQFIDICDKARQENKIVCVHCRMGRGRTGVMLACYLMKFQSQHPSTAMRNVRLMRPGSVETYQQERAVMLFRDYLHWGSLRF